VVMITLGNGGCSGTLIARDVVLTAAHCITSPEDMTVFFGNNTPFDHTRSVIKAETHPLWLSQGSEDLTYDIGLLRLAQEAPPEISPIPYLPSSLAIAQSEVENLDLNYVGFGVTETGSSGEKLQMTQVLMAFCEESNYCQINVPIEGGEVYEMYIPPNTIGISMNQNGGICHGDSGGPAFITRDGTEYVAGISSFVIHNNNDECDYFGASTKVDRYQEFIEAFLNSEICNNGIDDNDNGFIDCEDEECLDYHSCIPNACDEPEILYCGDQITDSTLNGSSVFNTYGNGCTSGFSVDYQEMAYAVAAPPDATVIINLSISDADTDLELFQIDENCDPVNCTAASTNPPGNNEMIEYLSGDATQYIIVDTWQNPGAYTISVECENLAQEICNNNLDDDFDGLIDCEDPDCEETTACFTGEWCDNGIDDDNDGIVDCFDADCRNDEHCLNLVEICDDDEDNDLDGAIDCEDVDCYTHDECSNSPLEICDNEIDDDNNALTDCNDPACKTFKDCTHPIEICDNGIDDDGDQKIDCEDMDCQSHTSCEIQHDVEICLDGLDNDEDNLADCEDDDCSSHNYCNLTSEISNKTSEDGCSCTSAGLNSEIPIPLLFTFMGLSLFIFRRRILSN
ncbi:MAG: trypsin-like serine protease, partial [Myxococcota bacterium]